MLDRTQLALWAAVALAALAAPRLVSAQAVLPAELSEPDSSEATEPVEPPRKAGPNDTLVVEQQRIADQFRHLEEVLLRMAEVSAANDPRRAALLRQAVAQSKDRLIGVQFEKLVALMNDDQLSRALEGQQTVDKDLRTLLELLMSEDRGRRLESEKARMREYLKRVDNLLKQQKSLQGRTAEATDPKALSKPQAELAQQTGGLAEQIKSHDDAGKTPPAEPKAAEIKPGEGKSNTPDGMPPKNGKPSEGSPQDGSPSPPTPEQDSNTPPAQQRSPAQQRLEAAQKRMRDAQEKLEQSQREKATEKQEEAIRELEQAKAALEEVLRQLREEEIGRSLAQLEARFRKMLQMQREVYDGTVRLGNVPAAEHTHGHDIEAGRLSGKESEIVLEADKAMTLMHEDGTAVAFPEALGQMREDMQQVAQRLSQSKVETITQSIEKDILAALEEMIEALQKAQKKLEEKKQQQQGAAQGQSQDPPLVDNLAELKMIRALQMRINSRTKRYSELIQGEQATNAEVIDALRRLAERQERVFRVTRDLEREQNQ